MISYRCKELSERTATDTKGKLNLWVQNTDVNIDNMTFKGQSELSHKHRQTDLLNPAESHDLCLIGCLCLVKLQRHDIIFMG